MSLINHTVPYGSNSLQLDLGSGGTVELPLSLTVEERIALCEEITTKYKDYLTYKIPKAKEYRSVGEQVESRLNLLGTYILMGVPKDEIQEHPVQTIYRAKQAELNEITISAIEDSQFSDYL